MRRARYWNDPMSWRHTRWVHGRAEWYRQIGRLHADRSADRALVEEIGARAASCLWAEETSPAYVIRERGRGKR